MIRMEYFNTSAEMACATHLSPQSYCYPNQYLGQQNLVDIDDQLMLEPISFLAYNSFVPSYLLVHFAASRTGMQYTVLRDPYSAKSFTKSNSPNFSVVLTAILCILQQFLCRLSLSNLIVLPNLHKAPLGFEQLPPSYNSPTDPHLLSSTFFPSRLPLTLEVSGHILVSAIEVLSNFAPVTRIYSALKHEVTRNSLRKNSLRKPGIIVPIGLSSFDL